MFLNVSNFVEGVDKAFVFILAICLFFLVGLTLAMLFFIYRYHKKRNPKASQIHGSTTLEILWTVIPLILVLAMFVYGWTGWEPMKDKAPDDAIQITAVGRMWSFGFEYPNGKFADSLYVPQGKAVELDLVAEDVVHSFYIPAFRLKQDMVPGSDKDKMWFIGNSPGSYDIFCAEYCGLRHSYMNSSVIVMAPEEFEKWYADTTAVQPETAGSEEMSAEAIAGLNILKKNGCNACHSMDGTRLVGPSYKGIMGRTVTIMEDGEEKEVEVDRDYIVRSIYHPNEQVVKGYPEGQMLSYDGKISEEEINQIIEYFKTLE